MENSKVGPSGPAEARAVHVSIGGMAVTLSIADSELADEASGKYSGFLPTGGADARLAVAVGIDPEAQFTLLPDIGIECRDGIVLVTRGDFDGVIDLRKRQARVTLNWPEYTIVGLDCFLRVCYSLLAVQNEGLLLHCAAVVRNGKGFVFPGVSGSGKSTVAGICRDAGCLVLSDEMAMIRQVGTKWLVFGTPFHGDLGTAANDHAQIAGLFFLKKSKLDRLDALDGHSALMQLTRSVVFFGETTELLPGAFETFCSAAASIPCYRMRFRRDNAFLSMIDGAANE